MGNIVTNLSSTKLITKKQKFTQAEKDRLWVDCCPDCGERLIVKNTNWLRKYHVYCQNRVCNARFTYYSFDGYFKHFIRRII